MTRLRLPNRRQSSSFEFEHEGFRFRTSISEVDGRVAEMFIDAAKLSSPLAAILRDAGIIVSVALQHGAGLDELRHAVTRDSGGAKPASPIGAALDAVEKAHAALKRSHTDARAAFHVRPSPSRLPRARGLEPA